MTTTHAQRGITIAVTSGKGGVGKTTLTVNLAIALAGRGFRVGILDADFGLGNVDVMLGLTPIAHIGAVVTGEMTLGEIGATSVGGVRVFPAGNGIRSLTALPGAHWARLRSGIADLSATLDYLLVDTGPGIGDTTMNVAHATDRALVVTTGEPTALVDAYAMTKLLIAASPRREVGLVVNMVKDEEEGLLVARQLSGAVQQFLGTSVRYYGHVALDQRVVESVRAQRPLMSVDESTAASLDYIRLARRIASATPPGADGLRQPAVRLTHTGAEGVAGTEVRSCA